MKNTIQITNDESSLFDNFLWTSEQEEEYLNFPALTDFVIQVGDCRKYIFRKLAEEELAEERKKSTCLNSHYKFGEVWLFQYEGPGFEEDSWTPSHGKYGKAGFMYWNTNCVDVITTVSDGHKEWEENHMRVSMYETLVCCFLGVQDKLLHSNNVVIHLGGDMHRQTHEDKAVSDSEETKPGTVYTYRQTISETTESSNPESKEWKCPAWGVRGHYRHFADGRSCYVRPHVKGKNKDKYDGRKYVLFKEQ